mgnify:CR=1 FL=1
MNVQTLPPGYKTAPWTPPDKITGEMLAEASTKLIDILRIRTQPIGRVSLVQHAYQVISLAQIAGSFRGSKFRPGRYQQVSCFGASGCALAGADQARDADRRAQFPTDRPELPGRSKRAIEQAHGGPIVPRRFAAQQRALNPVDLGRRPALAGLLHHGRRRCREVSRPLDLPDSSELGGEQNAIERHLNAAVLGRELAEQTA